MATEQKRDFADTYVFDDEVLEEMENFDVTAVLDEIPPYGDEQGPGDDLLDDVASERKRR